MFRWLFAIPAIFALIVIGLSVFLQPNNFMGCGKQPVENTDCDRADAVVVVSGGDTQARTEAGINLFKEGWANYLVLSGAAFDKTGPSNAAIMREQAIEAGVPDYAILVDEEAVNTQENAANSHSIFKDRDFRDVILVTSGYHQRRASLEFNKRAENTIIRNYPVVSDSDWDWYWWVTPRGWWLAGGEVVKIVAFYLGATS